VHQTWNVRQGYVSLAAARELYRVALDPETPEVHPGETVKLRGGERVGF
jgi:hypothetical protein